MNEIKEQNKDYKTSKLIFSAFTIMRHCILHIISILDSPSIIWYFYVENKSERT